MTATDSCRLDFSPRCDSHGALEVDRDRAARAWALLRVQHLDEGDRRPRELRTGVDGDLADQRRIEPKHRPLDPRQHDVVGYERRPDSGGGEPRRTLGLRGANGAAGAEPGPPADLLEDPGEAVIGVVEHPLPVGELLEADRVTRRERVARRGHDDELLPRNLLEGAAPRAERQRPDRKVGDALLDGLLEQRAMPELLKPDADIGIPLEPEPDVAREQADCHREHGCDLELARLERQRGTRRAPPAFDCAESRASLGQERSTRRREHDPARQTLDHRAADVRLERADVLGERRLRDPDLSGGARERSLLDDRDEARELSNVHRQILSLRLSTATCTITLDREDSTPTCARHGSTTSASRRSISRNPPGSTRVSSRWSGSRRRRSRRRFNGSASETCSSTSSSTRARRGPDTTSG